MTARDLFQLAVQLLGLAFLYHGILGFPSYLGVLYTAFGAHSLFAILQAIVSAGLPLIAGYWCVRAENPLVRLAYPESGTR
jgi:hypothetical protein